MGNRVTDDASKWRPFRWCDAVDCKRSPTHRCCVPHNEPVGKISISVALKNINSSSSNNSSFLILRPRLLAAKIKQALK